MLHACQCIFAAAKYHIYRLKIHEMIELPGIKSQASAQMSVVVIFNNFPPSLRFESSASPKKVCSHPCFYTPLHFFQKTHTCMPQVHLIPIHRQLAQQIDTALGFLVICKSAVTVMRAAQRHRRHSKCQRVSEE